MDHLSGKIWKLFSLFGLSVSCVVSPLMAELSPFTCNAENKEEAFLVRRIAEYWKDQDYKVVKAQIADFLAAYPKSKINDHLRGILGDLYLQENAYDDALATYRMINNSEIAGKIALNKLQCYYELGEYESMIREGSPFLIKKTEEIELRADEYHFLMAEAYFRTGARQEDNQKKLQMFKAAEPLYEKVMGSSFNDPTMFALAEIYRLRSDHKKAAALFTELADRHQDQYEELSFHAALAQSEFDRALAIETFSKIIEKKGIKAGDAALNRLILLFQEDRFREVVDAYEPVLAGIETGKQTTLDYIVGRSYFALEEYDSANQWLTKYLALADKMRPEIRNALLMRLNCAQNLKSEELYEETMSKLQQAFPKDSELPQATFIHAMMLKEAGDYAAAEKKLASLLLEHPDFEDLETLYLEYSLVTYNNENWKESRAILTTFLKKYPTSNHAPIAWKYYLSTSLNLLKELEAGRPVAYSKNDFFDDLVKVMKQDNVLTQNERKECLFLQGKIAYELESYDSAINCLTSYVSSFPTDSTASEAHLLIALCHHKMGGDPQLFCKHAEAALSGDSELRQKSSIHLELYTVYLSLIQRTGKDKEALSQVGGEKQLYELAAAHLYDAMKLQDLPIKLENKLWLANHFYDKAMESPQVFAADGYVPDQEHHDAYEKAFALFENILVKKDSYELIDLSSNQTFLEWEVLKLANLVGRQNDSEKKVVLLRGLIEQQTKHADWNWKLQKESLVELAKTYDLVGKKENAFETFSFIADNYRNRPTFVSEYAALHSLRLKFAMMKPDLKIEENADVFKILNEMKELQIRKSVASEPLHLEAALEYAWIRAQIAPENDRPMRYLFFLNRIKEDFQNTEDPMVIEYHKNLKSDPRKSEIYAIYMTFLEAEIARCEALLAQQDSRGPEGVTLMNKAKTDLSNIAESSSSFYLKIRSKMSLEAMKKSKVC